MLVNDAQSICCSAVALLATSTVHPSVCVRRPPLSAADIQDVLENFCCRETRQTDPIAVTASVVGVGGDGRLTVDVVNWSVTILGGQPSCHRSVTGLSPLPVPCCTAVAGSLSISWFYLYNKALVDSLRKRCLRLWDISNVPECVLRIAMEARSNFIVKTPLGILVDVCCDENCRSSIVHSVSIAVICFVLGCAYH